MKKIVLSLSFAVAAFAYAHAQEAVPQEEQILTPQKETTTQPKEGRKEGRKEVSEADVPQAVKDGFAQSEYQGMAITEAYELTGEALNEIPATTQGAKPAVIYELVVEDSSRSVILYFTEDGKLYDKVEKV